MIYSEAQHFYNYNLTDIVMPIDVNKLEALLVDSKYSSEETKFLVDGFRNGFDIGYKGTKLRQSEAKNIPFTVGNKTEMWNKIMKEVEAKRVAGPFETIPFTNYIQSPIGLVPKAGNKTRLIFHLSFDFTLKNTEKREDCKSVSAGTPHEMCTVRYNDLDSAIENCLQVSQEAWVTNGTRVIYLGKTDLSSAFRVLPMKKYFFCWLIFKAEDPADGKIKYFVDKCLPFGASISCTHYQHFLNAL